jgi:hypothetical protein
VAPLTALISAFRIGQSLTASVPSSMLSVSRLGEATEPESRWSRPITIGAETIPSATRLLNSQPGLGALAIAQPADAGGQPLEGHFLAGHIQPAVQVFILREERFDGPIGGVDILRVAGKRHPAEGSLALAEQRADIGGDKAREVEGVFHAVIKGPLAQVIAVSNTSAPAFWKASMAWTCLAMEAWDRLA